MSSLHGLISSDPAHYFPIRAGRYEIGAGLYRLDTDFGNGSKDSKLFQLDGKWPHYREQKMRARRERLDKYVCESIRQEGVIRAAVDFFMQRLPLEYPDYFSLQAQKEREWCLHCALSGEILCFDSANPYLYTDVRAPTGKCPDPAYASALDALACQIQEDLAVVEVASGDKDRVAALHLCYPNHWAAQDKIERSFAEIHAPVPGFDKIAKQSGPLLTHLLANGPYVRFAWGLASDMRLNHHPQPPEEYEDAQAWQGRGFRPDRPQLYLRIERQVLVGLAGTEALLFMIRTYFEDVAEFDVSRIDGLCSAIESMDGDTLRYKGIGSQRDEILDWLGQRRLSVTGIG